MTNTNLAPASVRPLQARPSLTLWELDDAAAYGLESLSPFCLKVHRALSLAKLPYARRHASRPSDVRAMNPTEQVPVLVVGELPVADSTAILARIEQLGGGSLLEGLDERGKAEALLWEELADTALNGFLVAARWADERNWARTRAAYFARMPAPLRLVIPGRLRAKVVGNLVARDVWRAGEAACWARFEATLDSLEARAPSSGFWLGERPTVADVAIFAQLQSLRTDLTPWQRERLDAHARLRAWLHRVDEATRPARSTAAAAE